MAQSSSYQTIEYSSSSHRHANESSNGNAQPSSDATAPLLGSSAPKWESQGQLATPRAKLIGAIVVGGLSVAVGLAFAALAIVPLVLREQTSEPATCGSLMEAFKWATTLWPIVFGAIVAAAFYSAALYIGSNSPARLGTLERLSGSRSVETAVKGFWSFGRPDLLAAVILVVWSFSLIGSQALQRILSVKDTFLPTEVSLQYVDGTQAPWQLRDSASNETINLMKDLALKAFLAPESDQERAADIWGSPKIPLANASSHSPEGEWTRVGKDLEPSSFASLLGVPIAGLPGDGETNLTINATYPSLDCQPWTLASILRNDTSWTYGGRHASLATRLDLDKHGRASFTLASDYPFSLLGWFFPPHDNTSAKYAATTCRVGWTQAQAHAVCAGRDCRVDRVRARSVGADSPFHGNASHDRPVVEFLANALRLLTQAERHASSGEVTLTERYLFELGPLPSPPPAAPVAMNLAVGAALPTFTGFVQRLSLLFNTYWAVGLAPRLQAAGPVTAFPAPALPATATLTSTRIAERVRCVASPAWVGVLLACVVVLLVAALAGAWLRHRALGPDVLGYVGSQLRDNPHTALPGPGGSALDGPALARAARDTRVQLVDVHGDQEVGHIALASGEGGRRLETGRTYE